VAHHSESIVQYIINRSLIASQITVTVSPCRFLAVSTDQLSLISSVIHQTYQLHNRHIHLVADQSHIMGSIERRAVLIIGASGIVGKSAVQEFINAGWETHGISRRYPEILAPEYKEKFIHHSLDLFDKPTLDQELPKFSFVTHILYTALIEQPGNLTDSWQSPENGQQNQVMMENCLSILIKVCTNLQHVQWLQGTKAYGVHYRGILVPAREREPRDPKNVPNWYWTQEDWMMEQLKGTDVRWTIHRPCCIWGDALGKPMTCTKTCKFSAF
jgi:nucleoside-diphosphate-sugar epimerase